MRFGFVLIQALMKIPRNIKSLKFQLSSSKFSLTTVAITQMWKQLQSHHQWHQFQKPSDNPVTTQRFYRINAMLLKERNEYLFTFFSFLFFKTVYKTLMIFIFLLKFYFWECRLMVHFKIKYIYILSKQTHN